MHTATAAPQPEFISLAELARRLNTSRPTIYKRVADGTIPAPLRFGPQSQRFNYPDVLAALAQYVPPRRAREQVQRRLKKAGTAGKASQERTKQRMQAADELV